MATDVAARGLGKYVSTKFPQQVGEGFHIFQRRLRAPKYKSRLYIRWFHIVGKAFGLLSLLQVITC